MIEREKPDYDDIIVKHIVKLIKTNPTLNDKYFSATKNRKYSLENYLYVILNVLRTGIPWRFVDKFKITKDIHWNSVYKTFIKIVNDKIISECYKTTLLRYLKDKPATKLNIQYTDTSMIHNKYGEEKVGRNMCHKGKKITKVSIITDSKGIPLNAGIYEGNRYDSAILREQLDDKNTNMIGTEIRKKTFMADKGYDSSIIREKLKEKGYNVIIPYNKRNTKDKNKEKKLNEKEKIYRKRVQIEYTFMKMKRYRRTDVRYDKKKETYETFVMLSLLCILIRSI